MDIPGSSRPRHQKTGALAEPGTTERKLPSLLLLQETALKSSSEYTPVCIRDLPEVYPGGGSGSDLGNGAAKTPAVPGAGAGAG